jgi:hypothetical protein
MPFGAGGVHIIRSVQGENMKIFTALFLSMALAGCVSGPPELTAEQLRRVNDMNVFKIGTTPDRGFKVISAVEAADCSGPGGSRLYGDEGKAIDILKMKAAAIGGDAVVDVSCGSAPFVNNCWAAKKCDGKAVSWR